MLTLNTSPIISRYCPPCSDRAPTLHEDVAVNGSILISTLSNKCALGFTGTPEFIKRGFNLCHNRSIIGPRAQMHCAYDRGLTICYVVIPDPSHERLLKGLTAQFRSEIIMAGEVAPLAERYDSETGEYDVTFHEETIGALAAKRAEAFIAEHITPSNFMGRQEGDESLAPIYSVSEMAYEHHRRKGMGLTREADE